MKAVGIIAEYNPFHNGHAYQIQKAKELSHADYAVVAMSGNFVQRGAPAILDKFIRTYMALSGGADFVFELPAVWATASAEYFASAGVALFDALGCIDCISFGCETPDLPLLSKIADILSDEPEIYAKRLRSFLKQGLPFPSARKQALAGIFHADLSGVLGSPNNILALEYLKALIRQKSALCPVLIERKGSGYHETDLNQKYCSATALRNLLLSPSCCQENFRLSDTLSSLAPQEAASCLMSLPAHFLTENDFSSVLYYKLLCERSRGFSLYADSSQELSNRICRALSNFRSFKNFCEKLKSKDMTYTRISRLLFHILLDIRQKDYENGRKLGYIPYLRLLGFRKEASGFFSEIKKHALRPVITKPAQEISLLSEPARLMFQKDIFSSDLYYGTREQKDALQNLSGQICPDKASRICWKNELQREIVKYPTEKLPWQ